MTTSHAELIRRMRNRYDEQCARFPRTAEIGWQGYLRANLPGWIALDATMWSEQGHGALESYK